MDGDVGLIIMLLYIIGVPLLFTKMMKDNNPKYQYMPFEDVFGIALDTKGFIPFYFGIGFCLLWLLGMVNNI